MSHTSLKQDMVKMRYVLCKCNILCIVNPEIFMRSIFTQLLHDILGCIYILAITLFHYDFRKDMFGGHRRLELSENENPKKKKTGFTVNCKFPRMKNVLMAYILKENIQ